MAKGISASFVVACMSIIGTWKLRPTPMPLRIWDEVSSCLNLRGVVVAYLVADPYTGRRAYVESI